MKSKKLRKYSSKFWKDKISQPKNKHKLEQNTLKSVLFSNFIKGSQNSNLITKKKAQNCRCFRFSKICFRIRKRKEVSKDKEFETIDQGDQGKYNNNDCVSDDDSAKVVELYGNFLRTEKLLTNLNKDNTFYQYNHPKYIERKIRNNMVNHNPMNFNKEDEQSFISCKMGYYDDRILFHRSKLIEEYFMQYSANKNVDKQKLESILFSEYGDDNNPSKWIHGIGGQENDEQQQLQIARLANEFTDLQLLDFVYRKSRSMGKKIIKKLKRSSSIKSGRLECVRKNSDRFVDAESNTDVNIKLALARKSTRKIKMLPTETQTRNKMSASLLDRILDRHLYILNTSLSKLNIVSSDTNNEDDGKLISRSVTLLDKDDNNQQDLLVPAGNYGELNNDIFNLKPKLNNFQLQIQDQNCFGVDEELLQTVLSPIIVQLLHQTYYSSFNLKTININRKHNPKKFRLVVEDSKIQGTEEEKEEEKEKEKEEEEVFTAYSVPSNQTSQLKTKNSYIITKNVKKKHKPKKVKLAVKEKVPVKTEKEVFIDYSDPKPKTRSTELPIISITNSADETFITKDWDNFYEFVPPNKKVKRKKKKRKNMSDAYFDSGKINLLEKQNNIFAYYSTKAEKLKRMRLNQMFKPRFAIMESSQNNNVTERLDRNFAQILFQMMTAARIWCQLNLS